MGGETGTAPLAGKSHLMKLTISVSILLAILLVAPTTVAAEEFGVGTRQGRAVWHPRWRGLGW